MNYKRIYDSIIDRGKIRVPDGYVERHHIIPKCLGGSDEMDNLVALTPEEHFLCHILLVKIHPDNFNLILAVNMMTMSSEEHKGKRTKLKLYGWLKKRFQEAMKRNTTGSRNSQFGSMWITNGISSKKIKKDQEIPDGWRSGRIYLTYKKVNKTGTDHPHYGTKWITDGISNKKIKKGQDVPDGWRSGKLGHQWITDGILSKMIDLDQEIPNGWEKGRKF